jgi:membrane-bound lytic murein transglycosylase F
VNRRFFPELRVAFDLTAPESLAWAFPISEDSSLYDAAVEFFAELEQDGDLEQLLERYYGHVREFDYVDTRVYIRHIENRLPRYRSAFERAARQHEIDWRLLAAVGYQESHWNPKATSPTGVRGIMMLTRRTATHMSVANRLDPAESIGGAARYFRWVRSRIPLEVDEPDRTWLALAAYNVGTGHLEDARRLTDERGGDPDRWIDVRETLPLLSQTPWYTRTRYGYARGREPVRYVEAVRRYYDLLAWIEQGKRVENTRDVDRAALVEP